MHCDQLPYFSTVMAPKTANLVIFAHFFKITPVRWGLSPSHQRANSSLFESFIPKWHASCLVSDGPVIGPARTQPLKFTNSLDDESDHQYLYLYTQEPPHEYPLHNLS